MGGGVDPGDAGAFQSPHCTALTPRPIRGEIRRVTAVLGDEHGVDTQDAAAVQGLLFSCTQGTCFLAQDRWVRSEVGPYRARLVKLCRPGRTSQRVRSSRRSVGYGADQLGRGLPLESDRELSVWCAYTDENDSLLVCQKPSGLLLN